MKHLIYVFGACLMCMFVCTAFAQESATQGDSYNADVHSLQVSPVSGPGNPNEINSTFLDILSVANGTSGNARAPVGTFRYERSAYLLRASELAAANFPLGDVTGIGFTYSTGPTGVSGGTLTVYLENTTDVTYSKGTTWATIISTMTTVHTASITFPTAAGVVDIPFSGGSTFTYTGGGIYVAFEYSNPLDPLSTGTVVSCNTNLTGGLAGGQSNTSLAAITLAASNFRPLTRLQTVLNDIIKIPVVYALGKIPIPYGVPQTITVPVTNVSASTSPAFDVTITVKDVVSGTVRFTETQSSVTIPAGSTSIISFSPWSPTITENDSIIVETSVVAGEDITFNNRAVMVQNVNTNRFAYSQGPTPTGGVGFNAATGDFVAKFVSGTSAVIDSIQVNFSASSATPKNYKLAIYDATGPGGTPGAVIYQSDSLTSVLGVNTLPVLPPAAVNGFFYLGVRQLNTTNVSFSYQFENPIRPSTFYFASPTGGTTWTDFAPNNSFRFMIEANIAPGSPMAYASSTTTQNVAPVLPNSTNQQVIGIEVVTTGNLLPLNATSFSLNTTGTTNAAGDISNAKIYYTGISGAFATTNQFGSTVAAPNGAYVVTGSQALVQGTNHFWLTYDINPGATANNVVDGECTSITVGGTPQTPTVTAPAGSRQIKTALAAGDYTVGLALFNRASGRSLYPVTEKRRVLREVWVPSSENGAARKTAADKSVETSAFAPGRMQLMEVEEERSVLMENGQPVTGRLFALLTDQLRGELGLTDDPLAVYPTITAALYDLNSLGVSGAVRFLLVDATYPSETYPLTINVTAPGVPTATNTVTIKPQTGVSPTVSGAAAGPIFKVYNTNYVTIDGSNTNGGTTRDMTIQNTGASGPQVVVFGSSGTTPITDCTLKNCVVLNGSTGSSAVIVSDGTTIGSSGYFNNIGIINNKILNAYIGTYVNAVATGSNGSGTTLLGNDLTPTSTDSIRYIGLYMQGVNGGLIASNDVGGFKQFDGELDRGIWVASGNSNTVVEKNKVHDLVYGGIDGWGPKGIAVSTTILGNTVTIKNNMFYNISGDGDNFATFGGTYCPIGIYVFGTRQSGINIYNNSISLAGNTLNYAGAYSIGIGLDDTCAATIKNNVVKDSLGLLGTVGAGAVAIAVEINNTQLTASNNNDFFSNSTGSGTNSVGKIGATDYATLGTWQAASGQDLNSASGDPLFVSNTDLHITDPLSPASNAGTPLAGVTDDFDGNPRNPTTPDMGADEFGSGSSTVTLGVPVAINWNIVSLPVSAPTPNDSVRNLYVNSVNPYAFAFAGGYQQRYTMANGPGYWIKSTATYTQDITGTQRDTLTVPVAINWNMIGSISTSIDTSTAHVTPSVPGLRGSNYFRYSSGYVVATAITPGGGYWVKANSAGSFFMHATGPAAKQSGGEPTGGRSVEDLNTITIQDANGGSQTLYFGADASGEIPVAMFAMPPAPPAGSFDARFVSSEGGLMVQTHPNEVNSVIDLPVTIQSSAYPLTVSWKVGDGLYELNDGAISRPVRGEGALRITNSEVRRLVLKVTGSSGLPKEFALSQNYPNPFNPTTSIEYALPVDSRVTMEIYNVLGQRVRTLSSDTQPAGYHVAEWNGKNNAGQQLSSGMYFLQLSARGTDGKSFNEVRKLMMLK